jgi:GT2 family glycosyltransferase
MKKSFSATAVVVTYNRKGLLRRCLDSLLEQTLKPARIVIIDNASTDGTADDLRQHGYFDNPLITYRRLEHNTGGAGGFHEGVRVAAELDSPWLWLMDDDAYTDKNALAALRDAIDSEEDIYASTAVFETTEGLALCFPAALVSAPAVRRHAELDEVSQVAAVPFLGFMVSKKTIARIGLPDKDLFISCDDVEYASRLKHIGRRVLLVKRSLIYHPQAGLYSVRFLGRSFFCLVLPPWRRYYDVRNRILVARKHFGGKLWYQTLPGLLVRLAANLAHEKDRAGQLGAYGKGIWHGLRGKRGMTVAPPGKQ